jgi:predicted SAM-dependent methyltransferase
MSFLKRINRVIRNRSVLKIFNTSPPLKEIVKRSAGPSLHIGPGNIDIPGWINIDARQLGNTHIVASELSLKMFSSCSVDQIYLCHIFEHLSYDDGRAFLKRAFQLLMPDGRIVISVPDFDKIVDAYVKNGRNIRDVKTALMGGQNYNENFHKSMYNKCFLAEILESVGFIRISEWKTEQIFGRSIGDWSDGVIPTDNGPIPISLNLQGFKP